MGNKVDNELIGPWFAAFLALGVLFIAGITLARHFGFA